MGRRKKVKIIIPFNMSAAILYADKHGAKTVNEIAHFFIEHDKFYRKKGLHETKKLIERTLEREL